VNIGTYPARNLFRRRGRTILTLLVIAVTVLIFCLLRTVDHAWKVGAEEAAKDRLATRHKVSITMQVPRRYIDDVRDPAKVPGIQAATWANWFGAKDPRERVPFFAGFAADHLSWFDVMDEMQVEPAALEAWKQTNNGAILGDVLAKSLEVKVGDDLTITSDIYPGDWKFRVVGIYKPLRMPVPEGFAHFTQLIDICVLEANWASIGDVCLIMAGAPLGTQGVTNSLAVHIVGNGMSVANAS
jgi:putative ABC transport system permease protein